MSFPPQLLALANYLSGEFDNREQALADPAWYVHLHLWQVPVPVFSEDSITIFAEQASVVSLDQPYRQRIMRLSATDNPEAPIQVQYYMPLNPATLAGGGTNPTKLNDLAPDQLDLLPGCVLNVSFRELENNRYEFSAVPPPEAKCTFTYLGNTVQVSLGFELTQEQLKIYDKGIEPETGRTTWGAILGPFCYTKRKNFSVS
ncbi:MAG: chromophore lyase CpcT/CpeT [Calothrix sp. C42_A2020_038]|nr:chromophore lyase CpcT/CpeT [Calothrix sp. C42_A2020_038]